MPLLVFASHMMGTPITLEFTIPELAAIVLAVATVVLISGDGECNWIEGAQLLSVYVILALLFYFCRRNRQAKPELRQSLPWPRLSLHRWRNLRSALRFSFST